MFNYELQWLGIDSLKRTCTMHTRILKIKAFVKLTVFPIWQIPEWPCFRRLWNVAAEYLDSCFDFSCCDDFHINNRDLLVFIVVLIAIVTVSETVTTAVVILAIIVVVIVLSQVMLVAKVTSSTTTTNNTITCSTTFLDFDWFLVQEW